VCSWPDKRDVVFFAGYVEDLSDGILFADAAGGGGAGILSCTLSGASGSVLAPHSSQNTLSSGI